MSDFTQFTSVFRAHSIPDRRKVTKRNRQTVSCSGCRSRKLKCDKQHPCGSCKRRGDDASCKFGPFSPSTGAEGAAAEEVKAGGAVAEGSKRPLASVSAPATAPKQEVHVRLQKLERMVQELVEAGGPQASQRDVNAMHQKVRAARQVNMGSSEHRGPLAASADVHAHSETGTRTGTDGAYHGATHWAALLNHIREIQFALDAEDVTTPATSASPGQDTSPDSPDPIFGHVAPMTIEDVVSSLPARRDADKLVSIYFGAKFAILPFIHVHHFQREYGAFWENPASASFLWISILFSVFCTATTIARLKGLEQATGLRAGDAAFYTSKSAQALVSGRYLNDQQYAVEALMMHAHTRNISSTESDSVLWAVYGLATRLAQRRGYHRDPEYLSRPVSPFEAELRRRAWFFVETFDLLLSFQLGMPAIVHEDECDAEGPGNHPDDDFDEDTVTMPPPRPPVDPTPTLYYCTKSKLCRVLRKVIRHSLSIRRPPYSETCALDAKLRRWKAECPASLDVRPIWSTSFSDPNHTVMHRLMLELMYRKALCVLHRAYLSQDQDKDEYEPSRRICGESALRILDLHAEFDRETKPGGRLYEDRWMLSSLALHDFMIAAMVICLDLNESKLTSSKDWHRKMDALRLAHGIWSERALSSQDARHASIVLGAMLRRLSAAPAPSAPQLPWSAPTPAPSSASTHEGFVGFFSLEAEACRKNTENARDAWVDHQDAETDSSFDVVDLMPLDYALDNPESLDWNVLDQYLLMTRTENMSTQSCGRG